MASDHRTNLPEDQKIARRYQGISAVVAQDCAVEIKTNRVVRRPAGPRDFADESCTVSRNSRF